MNLLLITLYFFVKNISLQITIHFTTFSVKTSLILYNINCRQEIELICSKIEEINMIRKVLITLVKAIATCAFVFALINANSVCALIYHQPELPDRVKKLRKF